MTYKGESVEFIQLVSYLGEEYRNKTFKENQNYFKEKINEKISFSCSFECPIEDMICINHKDVIGKRYTDEDKGVLLSGLEELKTIFPNSFINLHLYSFIEGEGNSIDITGEEFEELYG